MSEDESHWKDQPTYLPVINEVKEMMSDAFKVYADETACFGWMWIDPDNKTTCDQNTCSLRSYCKQAWQLTQVRSGQVTETDYSEAYQRGIDSKSRTRPLKKAPKERNKHKNSNLYNRGGYQPSGRVIDDLTKRFMDVLGNPEVVGNGATWTTASDCNVHGTQVSVKATASYHAVIYRGTIVARLWTNTSKKATIDITPELRGPLMVVAIDLAKTEARAPEVKKTPPNSWSKVRPCTHRISVHSEHAIEAVGQAIKNFYRF